MKPLQQFLISVAAILSLSAQADAGFKTLYRKGSWTVFRFDSGKSTDPPSYCSAKSVKGPGFFELVGIKQASCLSAESANWKFRKRKAGVGFSVGSSGVFVEGGNYFSNGLQICGPHKLIDALLDSISGGRGNTVDVLDYKKQLIGRFPAAGIKTAVRQWRACRNSL